MARPLRIEYDGAVYHVTSRGNARRSIFEDDKGRLTFLDILQQVNHRYNWHCHAYCLMKNHYHLVIETPYGNLSKGMRQFNGVYTQAFNRKHKRVGHVLQGRYKAILIQKESHPAQWRWSSYRATAGRGISHSCLQTDWVLGQFGRRRTQAERRYREFVKAGIGGKDLWKEVKGQSILGTEGFADTLLDYVKGYKEIQDIPKRQRYIDRPKLQDIFSNKELLEKKIRNRKIVEAIERHGYSQREIARYLGLHYASISRLARRE